MVFVFTGAPVCAIWTLHCVDECEHGFCGTLELPLYDVSFVHDVFMRLVLSAACTNFPMAIHLLVIGRGSISPAFVLEGAGPSAPTVRL